MDKTKITELDEASTKAKGNESETSALKYLQELGYTIISRNWSYKKVGEIDIIAVDPKRGGKECLIFIEVKSRQASIDAAVEAIPKAKQAQVRRLAQFYLLEEDINEYQQHISFDFIAISNTKLVHFKDAF